MKLLLIVLLPLAGIVLPPVLVRAGRTASAWAAATPTALALVLLAGLAPTVFEGGVVEASWPWMPALGLNLAFFLDGFGLLFAGLILGIGLLIILYARYYLSEDDPMGRFYAMLLAFMGAMLGIVLSDNILLLVVFWELTSISSFLLIGYWRHRADARQGARMALTVTGAGGLCLLAAAILLGHVVGSYQLQTILAAGDTITASPLYLPILGLVLLGAFTKSAQVPFHFWLPHAMAAPTPVSAYLHSATMVKAGVFLIARLYPALSGTEEWFVLVTVIGLATMVFGAYGALFKDDLKGLLAYSTISHLGLITLLFGLNTQAGVIAGVFHIINHATFKASLFMSAGIIDHETGTRDIRKLGGLRRYMPVTMWLAAIAAASMAGVPLFNGFLSKEMFFTEVVVESERLGGIGWLLPVFATIGGLLSAAYSLRFVHDVFFGDETGALPRHPHEPPRYMRVPVEILILICVIVGVVPSLVISTVLTAAAGGVLLQAPEPFSLALWHGFNIPLVMSVIALAGAVALYYRRDAAERWHERTFPAFTGKGCFESLLAGAIAASRRLTAWLDDGSVQRNVVLVVGAAVVMAAAGGVTGGLDAGSRALTPAPLPAVAVWLMGVIATVVIALRHHDRFLALVATGVVGLLSALTFIYISAPDLALTQLSVEVVSTVLLLLALNVLPKETPHESSPGRRWRDGVLAVAGGGGIAALAYAAMTRPLDSISRYFLETSVPGGGGHNVVNVILVDFRGFDTFGEITVLGIAALCVYALIRDEAHTMASADTEARHPRMLLIGSRVMLPLLAVVTVYVFLRGHNQPGGGFIAGLIAAVAMVTQYMASGVHWTEQRLTGNYFPMIGAGLLTAGFTGLASWLFDVPFLTSTFSHVNWPVVGDFEIASAVAFDLGVFLTVVGSVVLMLSQFGKQQPPVEGR
ncbi:Na(+)/H(+) antiporter subunit A [wastewater metagenome]|uniref:Na(+)/H(+) antiporter subunit A n=4 Tax=root TaxID=1 RepID=A0A5B8R8N8_9ZZZZ|nr:Na(+)/H(+) antiporter subunit A [uncultured organism]